nr:immunoglobulin light chain junction region [Macaca mulatta]MOW39248.1 immunoglobulin light chain junction region [Macaca mulatta]MOW39625.1 immunoglobulin light chain junction region [Macaca mulatta]MOW39643.1 immunoglobulin light chain junction region [Macaca mulatta]MOW39692.1 immunoglobulin light chain junction region [Macaca mulatta]
CQQHNIYPPTF